MSRIFVTGATGTCGTAVVRELLAQGFEVVAHSRYPTRIEGCINAPAELYAMWSLHRHLSACDGIIHLASTRLKRRNLVVSADILGTGSLLDMWERGPFVYASSQMVYGISDEPATEETPVQPTSSWYDMGKYVCEFQVGAACDQKGRGAGIALRIPVVLSASRAKGQTLDMLYRDAVRGATFVFESEETLETAGSDFIGVHDLAKAMVRALTIPTSGPYNVSGGYFTWKELLDGLVHLTGAKAKSMIRPGGPRAPGEVQVPQRRSRLDTTKFARAAPDFAPSEKVDEILAEFAARVTGNIPAIPEEASPDLGR